MKELLKWGAILTGAYLIYQQVTGSHAVASQTSGPPATQPATNPPATTTAAASTTRQLLMAAANNPAALNFHNWNWYYNQVRGVQPAAPESYGMVDGLRLLTVDEYLAAIGTGGLSGFRSRWTR